jgi:aryl-alcohol dehydrogenase-like predicted oxidoreductase
VLQTLGDLVQAGKIRYFGFSDIPAWYATKAATLAQAHGVPSPVAMQMEYSLVARTLETEHVPAARECGLGIVPWSPLAAGFLAGKYERAAAGATGEGRLSGPNPFGNSKFTERNWQVLDVLRQVATEAGQPLAQVALAWALTRPGVSSLIVGASKLAQLHDNLAALNVSLTPEQLRTLNAGSVSDPAFPEGFFSAGLQRGIFGGHAVQGWQ